MFGVVLYLLFRNFSTAWGGEYNSTPSLSPEYPIQKLRRGQRTSKQRWTCWPAAELAVTSLGFRLYAQ